ncbi:HK97 gp10 family phage protein [Pullulanibacillus pueri]|uniref:HK97 gp10 family phage protein n=1 Tax=Pullulanibacillus pueri TaxID=1437324 RepID=A0A8J2ZXG1_9BACL|nr:HK97-gp10 family putative phage morphogenesis protein [Pullulanibacillus pueri]MBM7681949.1 HK97 gp10 family phage protein [Pullulanibacillus pueri]GGH83560.1 hypothetical protein GCM10007096_24610 [Pullulanibacillus pueri]
MSTEIDYSGLDRQFLELAARTKSGGKKAAKAGAQIVADKLKENTPYDPDTEKHLIDDVEISRVNDLGEYQVHFGKDTAWRSKFVNDGTINQPAQHFAEKTEAEARGEVTEEMQKVIEKELNGL